MVSDQGSDTSVEPININDMKSNSILAGYRNASKL